MLNLKKLTHFFISCFTLFVCLSMLGAVVFAQEVNEGYPLTAEQSSNGFNRSAPSRTSEVRRAGMPVVTTSLHELQVDVSVLSQSAVVFGDEMDYRVVIRNDSVQSVTSATMIAPIAYGTRFNLIERGSPTFTYHITDNQIEISATHGITLTPGASEIVEFEVDTAATCGHQIVSEIIVRANGEAITRTKTAMIWDMVHRSYNFEGITQTTEQAIEKVNLFTTASGEWQVGTVLSPTFLGVASGRQAWGTNLAGSPQSGQHVLEGMLDLRALQGSDEVPLYLTWQEYFDPATSTNKGQVYIDGELIHEVSHSDFAQQVGYLQRVVNIQQFAGQEVSVRFVFEAEEDPSTRSGYGDQAHLGWYIDDLAVTQCDIVQFNINSVASTDPTATCDMNSSSIGTEEHPAGWMGLILYEPSDVYYCYAIENTGNVTLTDHHLSDDLLGDVMTSTHSFVVPPGSVRDTVSHGVMISKTITEHTSNRATWKAGPSEFYQIVTNPADDVSFHDIWGIGRILEVKDDSEIRVKLPFDFEYFGTTYEAGHGVVIGNNGGFLFANEFGLANVPAINSALPLTGSEGMNQAIFPFWDDLDDGWVLTDTQGVAPQREFVVQWTNMPHKNGTSYKRTVTFQARLYESSNEIAFFYKDVDFEDERFNHGTSATIGLNKSQSSALQYAFNRDVLTDGLEIRFVRGGSATDSEHIYVQKAAIELNATVSREPERACEASDKEMVWPNEQVTYCYTVKNTGNVTLTRHELIDSELGILIDRHPIILEPGMTYTFKSEPAFISEHTTNQVEWHAWVDAQYSDTMGTKATATDTTTVTVNFIPSIELTATVGIYRNSCATTTEISVTAGTTVYYCFMVENTGNVTLSSHNLSDTIVGINNIYNFQLGPGEKINITEIPAANVQGKSILTDTTNKTEWTAINHWNHLANDEASVQVYVNFMPPLAVTMDDIHVSMVSQERLLDWLATVLLLLVAGRAVYARYRQK